MSITKLKNIIEGIPYNILIDFVEHPWFRGDFEILWNKDNNIDDLKNGEGNTFQVEYYRDGVEHEGYFIVNVDNGCGEMITTFFNMDKEVKEI